MELRRATKEDIAKMIEMRFLYLEEDLGSITEKDRAAMMQQLPNYFMKNLNQSLLAYLAIEDGIVASTVMMSIMEKPANPRFITGRTGTLLNVYTRPEYRRQGIARRLIEQALSDAKEMNLSYVDLQATKDGYPLYKSIGFQEPKADHIPMKYLW